jgi:hypothetical protein
VVLVKTRQPDTILAPNTNASQQLNPLVGGNHLKSRCQSYSILCIDPTSLFAVMYEKSCF